jgi:predicted nucleic acid-binding protein
MELGVAGLVSLVWTERIEAEWIAAVLRSRPNLEDHLRRTASLMRQVLPEACGAVDPADEAPISLPDPDDGHVVAAAQASSAEAIVTFNVADFLRVGAWTAEHRDHHARCLSSSRRGRRQ